MTAGGRCAAHTSRQRLSRFCYDAIVSDVCSECLTDDDCAAGEACVFDNTNIITGAADYAVCASDDGLGDPCTADTDCASGFCYDPVGPGPLSCSECKVDTDCGASNFTCDFDLLKGYAECNGTSGNGGECTSDAECAGGSCADNVCLGALGSDCTTGSACASGFCGDNTIPLLSSVCSECETNADCNGGACNFDFVAGYRVCQ